MTRRCRIFGHVRKSQPGQYWHRRSWQWRPTTHYYCTRCGAGQPECWDMGLLARWKYRIEEEWHRLLLRLKPGPLNPIDANALSGPQDDIPF